MRPANRVKKMSVSPTVAMASRAIELKDAGADLVDFSVGEPDFPTPGHIKEAAAQAMRDNHTFYTANSGLLDLREAICEKLYKDNNLRYDPAEILVSNGAKHALFNTMLALIEPGDEVIIPAPYWGSYPEITRLGDGIPVIARTRQEDDFRLQPDVLEGLITDKTRLFLFCNPVNPTGTAYTKEQLVGLVEVLLRHPKVSVIADEIYEKLLYDGLSFTSFAALHPQIRNRTVIINGLSKAYAMTGWRIGYAAGPREIIDAAGKIQSHSTSAASTISQHAAIAALAGPQGELREMLQEFERRRNLMLAGLQAIPGFKTNIPQGAFYVFPDISGFFGASIKGMSIGNSVDFAALLLEHLGIALVPGSGFGAEGFIRISYSTSQERIQEGLRRMREGL